MSDHHLIWVDLETTGLDTKSDCILEVAAVITDNQLEVLRKSHWVLHFDLEDHLKSGGEISENVLAMHRKNGLWKRCARSGLFPRHVEDHLTKFIVESNAAGAPLAGASVHFDRKWLEAKMPKAMEYVHYRNVDCSALWELARRWYGVSLSHADSPYEHRAQYDVLQSIQDLRNWKDILFKEVVG